MYRSRLTFAAAEESTMMRACDDYLPSDAFTQGVDEQGSRVAFYSRDTAFCENQNTTIPAANEFRPAGWEVTINPSRSIRWTGWEIVQNA